MSAAGSFVGVAAAELGYLEKSKKNWDLYGINCLFEKTKFAGADNVTKYAYETGHYNKYGWAAWCQSFVNWCLMAAFGTEKANKLLCGKYSSPSTMDVKSAMVAAGRGVDLSKAQPGDIVFRSRTGGGHVGIVKANNGGVLTTIEGNSSSKDLTSWNGGAVVEHVGALWNWCCRPDWSLVEAQKEEPETWRWLESGGEWYYQSNKGENKHGWQKIKESAGNYYHWYYFNQKGQMLTGLQFINSEMYVLQPSGTLKGAMCITDESGKLHIQNLTE